MCVFFLVPSDKNAKHEAIIVTTDNSKHLHLTTVYERRDARLLRFKQRFDVQRVGRSVNSGSLGTSR